MWGMFRKRNVNYYFFAVDFGMGDIFCEGYFVYLWRYFWLLKFYGCCWYLVEGEVIGDGRYFVICRIGLYGK